LWKWSRTAGCTLGILRQSKIVVDAAEEAGVEHVVHLGAMAPGDTDLPQFSWHLDVERYITRSKLGCALSETCHLIMSAERQLSGTD
jgi:hypothetical protein